MNLLYCGDKNIEDGLLISVLSLLRQANGQLHIYVLTIRDRDEKHEPVSDETAAFLDDLVKQHGRDNFVKKLDITELFYADMPSANMETRFTPYCMLRLYADEVKELPDRLLYLDNDVVCRRDPGTFYSQDMDGCEAAGVLDYYGGWFFRKKFWKRDYLNSGVLLLNLKEIRASGLFEKCRQMCRDKQMFMPDQSAINKLAVHKKICPRCYNEQRKLKDDTVFQHFTTSFRFFPWVHTLTVKPWQVGEIHDKLKLHEYDDILTEYTRLVPIMKT